MKGICGADCNNCELLKTTKCKGCNSTNGCPFGKKCWIAKYIEIGGKENFEILKRKIVDEIKTLNIEGMSEIKELYPLQGSFINLEYLLPNNTKAKFLLDDDFYLGTQVESDFNNDEVKKYFGIVANMNFILVSEYEGNRKNPQIVIYRNR